MYKQIKQLADEAVALQNKDRMDAALREISDLCDRAKFNAVPAPGESLPVFLPVDTPAGTAPGSTVAATGISDGAGNETSTSVTETPSTAAPLPKKKVSAKKGGAK